MKDVIIISNYWHFKAEKSSSRYLSIAEMLANNGINTEVITSTFYHTLKKQRDPTVLNDTNSKYKTYLAKEPGYKKNISVMRIISHRIFAKNVLAYLKKRKTPDVIYLFVPPIELAKRIVKYANKNGIRLIIDVLDLWPEAFGMITGSNLLLKCLTPMKKAAEYVYKNADEIVTVSKTYADKIGSYNNNCSQAHSIFIGTKLKLFDENAHGIQRDNNKDKPVIAYIGMLGHSYDLISIMQAMKQLKDKNIDVCMKVMGDGPLLSEFESCADELGIDVIFTGRLPYEEMIKQLVQCDIAVNPIVEKSVSSIINKHSDYVAAGLPVINIQSNREFGDLLTEYNAGFACKPGDINSIANAIETLYNDKNLRIEMGKNSRRLAEEKFDRANTYNKIIELIEK